MDDWDTDEDPHAESHPEPYSEPKPRPKDLKDYSFQLPVRHQMMQDKDR